MYGAVSDKKACMFLRALVVVCSCFRTVPTSPDATRYYVSIVSFDTTRSFANSLGTARYPIFFVTFRCKRRQPFGAGPTLPDHPSCMPTNLCVVRGVGKIRGGRVLGKGRSGRGGNCPRLTRRPMCLLSARPLSKLPFHV